jgi:uncharacterized protein (UPF0248 family)
MTNHKKIHRIVKIAVIIILVIMAFFAGKYVVKAISINQYKPNVYYMTSDSMEHNLPFEGWWITQEKEFANYKIDKFAFRKFPWGYGINKGEYVVIAKMNKSDVEVGDVVMFKPSDTEIPWISRIVQVYTIDGQTYFDAKSDHNQKPTQNEFRIPIDNIIGDVDKIIR